MPDPTDMTDHILRQIQTIVSRTAEDVRDMKSRLTGVEENLAGVNRRLDRLENRVERIERRLDLVDAPT